LAILVRSASGRSNPENPEAWICRIVRNRCATQLRAARRANAGAVNFAIDVASQQPQTQLFDLWEQLEDALRGVRPQLPEPDKELLRALAAGETRREMAHACGKSIDGLERRVRKSLESVRNWLLSNDSLLP
jgi:DNA-directed RNA polymerase specialized sigma24 family protein